MGPARVGINPITLSADGETLYFGSMNGKSWFSVPAKLFRNGASDAVPYELIEKVDDETKTRTTYRIHATAPGCLYQVLSLTHLSGKGHANGCEVTAYGSEGDYRADKAGAFEGNPADAMSCYLVPTSYDRKRPQR